MTNKETVMRREITKCEPDRANAFVANLKINNYVCRSEKKADGKAHQDRYKFYKGTEKISVVYDTKANKLCMDAAYEVLNALEEILNGAQAISNVVTAQAVLAPSQSVTKASTASAQTLSAPRDNVPQRAQPTIMGSSQEKLPPQKIKLPPKQDKKSVVAAPSQPQIISVEPQKPQPAQANGQNSVKEVQKPPQPAQSTQKPPLAQANTRNQVQELQKQSPQPTQNVQAEMAQQEKLQNNSPKQAKPKSRPVAPNAAKVATPITPSAPKAITPTALNAAKASAPVAQNVPTAATTTAELEYKNGFSVKKISAAKLEKFIEKVNMLPSIKLVENNTKTIGVISYIFEDSAKQRVTVRYVEAAMVVQLQGKRSNLFSEMQVLISRDTDYLEAVGSHIVLVNENKKAGEIHKLLKKRIPDAYNYLTDQSKIDMTYGLIDINNEKVFLSDYSVLLVPPYRGLEKFIYDLQQAKEITVKMIGQAFDKDDGKYVLKSGYRKKINSVIYEEVLTSLYTEYFEKRNFYAHSDCTESGVNRGISDKNVAKSIFDNLLDTVNYNCKKLKEINFEINSKQK